MENGQGKERGLTAGRPGGHPALRLSGLRKSYGPVKAVDGVDLTLAPGEVVALLGPNGAGKSTVVDMITGLTRPDEGEVEVFGTGPGEAVKDGRIGVMLQEGALLDDATVGEMVAMVASLHRSPLSAPEALKRAGIEDLARRRSTKLSGGQKQRVRFAIAMVSDPDLLILDEPTAGMDVATRKYFWESMKKFTESGHTVIFATHYLEEAEEVADRIIFLREGRLAADGSVEEVRALAEGRTLTATIPDVAEESLLELPHVVNAEVRMDKAVILSSDSDTTLRALLERYPEAVNIEVVGVGLDEAFLVLTSKEEGSEQT